MSSSQQRLKKTVKKAKFSVAITSLLLKLFYSILFTTGSVFQYSGLEDTLSTKCYKYNKWSCTPATDEDEILDCMKNYRFGFFVGGAIVFFVAIILEVVCVFYKLYIKQLTRIHHIMCGVYALGSILLWIAAVIMEIELADVAPALWIVGGVVVMIGQMFFCKTLSIWIAYIPAIIASLLFVIARGIFGIDYIANEMTVTKVYVHEVFIRYKAARYTALEFSDLQAKLMISGSVLYILHAFLFYIAVNGKISATHQSMQTEETSVHRDVPRSSLRNKRNPTKVSSFLDLGDQIERQ